MMHQLNEMFVNKFQYLKRKIKQPGSNCLLNWTLWQILTTFLGPTVTKAMQLDLIYGTFYNKHYYCSELFQVGQNYLLFTVEKMCNNSNHQVIFRPALIYSTCDTNNKVKSESFQGRKVTCKLL